MSGAETNKPVSTELVPVARSPGETDLDALGLGGYQPPEDIEALHEREKDGKRFILYVGTGEMALVDVVDKGYVVENVVVPDILLLRVEAPKANAMDVFNNPQRYAAPNDARRVFDHAA